MIVFTIYKNGGNAGVLGASFSCVEMSAKTTVKISSVFFVGNTSFGCMAKNH